MPDPIARRADPHDGVIRRSLTVESVEEIGLDYAETLKRWRASFHEQLDAVRALGYGEHFERTWDFYLACCEGGFRSRALRDAQLVLCR